MPEVVSRAAVAVMEPIREVFVGLPELKTWLHGYAFGWGSFLVALLIIKFAHF